MKKTKLLFVVGLALIIGAMSFLGGCSTTPKIPPELIVQPDPANPIQGTWIERTTETLLLVIEDYNGSWYLFKAKGYSGSWIKIASYTIEKVDDEYIINSTNTDMNTAKIKTDGDILFVGNSPYKLFVN
jgi:hypothetical protein